MADNIMGKRFYLPVYKSDGSGDLIEAGDTLKALLHSADGTKPIRNLTLSAVGADGKEVFWEYDATNLYTRSEDVFAVDPDHQWNCPEAANIGLVAIDDITVTVTSVSVCGTEYTGLSFAVTSDGASELQAYLNEKLVGNGIATVVYVDAATDYLQVYVMGTTCAVEVNGEPLVALP
jgi:hypothetical protein